MVLAEFSLSIVILLLSLYLLGWLLGYVRAEDSDRVLTALGGEERFEYLADEFLPRSNRAVGVLITSVLLAFIRATLIYLALWYAYRITSSDTNFGFVSGIGLVATLASLLVHFHCNWTKRMLAEPIGIFRWVRFPEFLTNAVFWFGISGLVQSPVLAALALLQIIFSLVLYHFTDTARHRIFGKPYRQYSGTTGWILPKFGVLGPRESA